jgi:hypothetical protein
MLIAVFALQGCATTAATDPDAATWIWYKGALQQNLDAAVPQVTEATRETLEELDLVGVDAVLDKLRGRITARMADGTKVTVRLKAIDFEQSTVVVKVGFFGDRAIAEQIIRHIKRRL